MRETEKIFGGIPGKDMFMHNIMGMPEATLPGEPERITFFVLGGGGFYPMRLDDPDFNEVHVDILSHNGAHAKYAANDTPQNAWEVIQTDQALPEELQGHVQDPAV